MSSLTTTRPALARLAGLLACGLATNLALPVAVPALTGAAHASGPAFAPTVAGAAEIQAFRTTLAQYGAFRSHARYGEVWVPAESTVPTGWHPYEPCNWVYQKDLGWYYDDPTEWGRIVHHYGRWAHDAGLGWVWIAGAEFSPGWVVWRTSESHVGWAPLPPDQDVKTISAQAFNTDKHWIFMNAKTFGTRCAGGPQILAAQPAVFETTRLVTEIRMVHGIAVFVLPASLVVNIVDIDINVFHPWTPCFFGAWFWNWNFVQNNIVINVNFPLGPQQCTPPAPAHQPPLNKIKSDPPPAPGKPQSSPPSRKPEQRADDDHPGKPPIRVGQGPLIPPVIITPPPRVVADPPRNTKPPRVVIDPPRGQTGGKTGPQRDPVKPSVTHKRPSFDAGQLAAGRIQPQRSSLGAPSSGNTGSKRQGTMASFGKFSGHNLR